MTFPEEDHRLNKKILERLRGEAFVARRSVPVETFDVDEFEVTRVGDLSSLVRETLAETSTRPVLELAEDAEEEQTRICRRRNSSLPGEGRTASESEPHHDTQSGGRRSREVSLAGVSISRPWVSLPPEDRAALQRVLGVTAVCLLAALLAFLFLKHSEHQGAVPPGVTDPSVAGALSAR